MIGTDEAPGVVPRAIEHVWGVIQSTPSTEWNVYLTYVELYK